MKQSLIVKNCGGSAWTAAGTYSLIFTDEITLDGCSRMKSGRYKNILSAHLQRKASELVGSISGN